MSAARVEALRRLLASNLTPERQAAAGAILAEKIKADPRAWVIGVRDQRCQYRGGFPC